MKLMICWHRILQNFDIGYILEHEQLINKYFETSSFFRWFMYNIMMTQSDYIILVLLLKRVHSINEYMYFRSWRTLGTHYLTDRSDCKFHEQLRTWDIQNYVRTRPMNFLLIPNGCILTGFLIVIIVQGLGDHSLHDLSYLQRKAEMFKLFECRSGFTYLLA